MNPWKIIGWIVLIFLVLLLATCGLFLYGVGKAESDRRAGMPTAASESNPPPPAHSLQVISVNCSSRGRDRGDVTVRNTGATTVEFAKAFMQFKDAAGNVVSANDSYFSPHDIPPGSIASADVYSEGNGAHSCALVAVQDSNGIPATLAQ